MHEQLIANDIISQAKQEGEISSIVIEVGDLSHLPAEDLEKTLRELVHWQIVIKQKKALVACSCGYKGEPKILQRLHDTTIFECPECKKIPVIVEGDKIILKEVTLK